MAEWLAKTEKKRFKVFIENVGVMISALRLIGKENTAI